jgi:hypothetical protein
MGLARTAFGATAALIGNFAGSVSSIYWTESTLSLFGLMLFQLVFLTLSFLILSAVLAARTGDRTVLLTHAIEGERRFFCMGRLCKGWGRDPADTDDDDEGDDDDDARFNGDVATTTATSDFAADNDGPLLQASSSPSQAPLPFARLSQTELMFIMGLNNTFAATTQFYATPPSRTPPLLQAVFPVAAIVAAIPMSKHFLGDKKLYRAWEPALAVTLIVVGVVVAMLPSALAAASSSPSPSSSMPSPATQAAWSSVFLLSQALTALAFILQQVYLVREGVLHPSSPPERLTKAMARLLLYNQFFVVTFLMALWWMDILPWWGSTAGGVDEWANGVGFAFACSLLGPDGVTSYAAGTGSVCTPESPRWAFIFFVSYIVYLVGTLAVNTDSAVFSAALSVGLTLALSVFWLIPGTNPYPQETPIWSVAVSVVLAMAGMVLLKLWEARTPPEEQFGLAPLRSVLRVLQRAKEEEEERNGDKGGKEGEGEEEEGRRRENELVGR